LAAIQHETVQRFYANRAGVNPGQATWITSILPYLEENALFNEWTALVRNRSRQPGMEYAFTGEPAYFRVLSTPVVSLYCPSRRQPLAYPTVQPMVKAARTDYALNGGASNRPDEFQVKWPGIWDPVARGVSMSTNIDTRIVRYKDITDGVSKTYLIGEKAVSSDHYETGKDEGDIGHLFNCAGGSCVRFAKRVPVHDVRKGENCWNCHNFGSAHPTSWNAVYCDGSVHSLTYDISFATHTALASRAAGDKVSLD
jgi:hypothetical protein